MVAVAFHALPAQLGSIPRLRVLRQATFGAWTPKEWDFGT